MMPETTWENVQNILCIRLDALGDVLMTTPAIRALKESRPGRRLTLLTSPSSLEIAQLVPDIDEVLVYEAPWMKATAWRENSRFDWQIINDLRSRQFDAAVIFTVYSQNPLPSALLCYLADIPLRLAHCRENPYQLLTHWILDPEPAYGIRHEVRRQLDLVAQVGCRTNRETMGVRVGESDRDRILNRLREINLDRTQPWIIIHPGATALSRRYPPEGFAAVGRRLHLDRNFQILFTGTQPEGDLVRQIQSRMGLPSFSLVGCLTVSEMVALIAIAPLLISNNTGPVHIAAAVGTPVVDLYALTNPQHTPWAIPNRVLFHDVPCKFCYKSICPETHNDCLRLVTPDEIAIAACELLSEVQAGVTTSTFSLPFCSGWGEGVSRARSNESSAQEIWR